METIRLRIAVMEPGNFRAPSSHFAALQKVPKNCSAVGDISVNSPPSADPDPITKVASAVVVAQNLWPFTWMTGI